MRYIDQTIKDKLLLAQQTLFNNAQPSMEVIAVRPRTAIFHERFWQESIVTEGVTAVCTSVAVKRTGRWGEAVYVAYVAGGTLTVKSAPFRFPIRAMSWTTLATIPNCTACALEFEGHFVHVGRNVEFKTDAIPYLFYVTSAGALLGGILGSDYETIAGANVTAVDVINGVSNTYDMQNQGFFVFYIANGSVYYNNFLDGEWQGQTAVSIAPANAVSLKAERTFDYRIVLQVTDNTGALYELFAKMEATGWNNSEYISLGITGQATAYDVNYVDNKTDEYLALTPEATASVLYALPPEMAIAENIDNGSGDYGYFVRIIWDENISIQTTPASCFALTDAGSGAWGGQTITQDGRYITIGFDNFNNLENPATITYTPGSIIGDVESAASQALQFTASGLVPFATAPPVPVLAENIIDEVIA